MCLTYFGRGGVLRRDDLPVNAFDSLALDALPRHSLHVAGLGLPNFCLPLPLNLVYAALLLALLWRGQGWRWWSVYQVAGRDRFWRDVRKPWLRERDKISDELLRISCIVDWRGNVQVFTIALSVPLRRWWIEDWLARWLVRVVLWVVIGQLTGRCIALRRGSGGQWRVLRVHIRRRIWLLLLLVRKSCRHYWSSFVHQLGLVVRLLAVHAVVRCGSLW